MRIGVKILPKKEVLDSQGRAVEKTLKQNSRDVMSCRVGKYVILEFEETDSQKALEKAKSISQFVLHNPLIESFELEVLG